MPSSTPDYPPLSNWQDLERLAVDLFTAIYQRPFQRWGREGQDQDGIDAWALMPNGKAIVLQCKGKSQRLGKRLTTHDVDAALKAIGDFKFEIEDIFLLTTAPDDVGVLHHAAALSAQRLRNGHCGVHVWGWGTICDQINLHEKVQQTHFGHWFKKASVRQWVGLAAAMGLIATASVVYGSRLLADQQSNRLMQQASVKELQQFVTLAEDLQDAQGRCEQLLTSRTFTFQAEFRHACTEPIALRITDIEQQVQKVAPSMASSVWTDLHQLSKLMAEDQREAEMAAYATRSFEDEVVQGMRDLCFKERSDELRKARAGSLRRAGHDGMTFQLRHYFLLRDFIIPGLEAMKALVQVRSRELTEQPVPPDLQAQAMRLAMLLQERRAYAFKEPAEPFSLSVVKAMSSRDIQISGVPTGDIEEARWQDVLRTAPARAFYGRPKDIEALIACGVFKPQARELATRMQQ